MRAIALWLGLFVSVSAHALTLDQISSKDAGEGLKQALGQGAGKAVDLLGKNDGFLANPKVRIPLPQSLQKVEGLMRGLGMGKYADELVTAMNRAAEAAVPEAKALLLNSLRQMSVSDAKAVLTGGDDAATQYFKRTTSAALTEKFRPIVKKAMAKVNLAEKYDQFAGRAAKFGLVKEQDLESAGAQGYPGAGARRSAADDDDVPFHGLHAFNNMLFDNIISPHILGNVAIILAYDSVRRRIGS